MHKQQFFTQLVPEIIQQFHQAETSQSGSPSSHMLTSCIHLSLSRSEAVPPEGIVAFDAGGTQTGLTWGVTLSKWSPFQPLFPTI